MRKARVYALYRGDEFIDLGTIEEMAERLGMTRKLYIFTDPLVIGDDVKN